MEQADDAELQLEAVSLVKSMKAKGTWLLLPATAKLFFRKLAAHLGWTELEAALK